MNEYIKQAEDFLQKAQATCEITFIGLAKNVNWNEKELRNMYSVTLTTPRGSMTFDFWDSIYNTELTRMDEEAFSKKFYKMHFRDLTLSEKLKVKKELERKKAEARPSAYDVLACITKYDPSTFKDFCADFGYSDDSILALKTYVAAQAEYFHLTQIFTPEQMEELQEIY